MRSPQPPAPLSYDDVSKWITGLLNASGLLVTMPFPTFNEGPYIPEMPDELLSITITGGTGFQMEGAADAPTFQIRIRSGQNNQSSARSQANVLDGLIFQAAFPTRLASGANLSLVSRVGGAPDSIGPPDDAYRYDYVCNYYAIVGAA